MAQQSGKKKKKGKAEEEPTRPMYQVCEQLCTYTIDRNGRQNDKDMVTHSYSNGGIAPTDFRKPGERQGCAPKPSVVVSNSLLALSWCTYLVTPVLM